MYVEIIGRFQVGKDDGPATPTDPPDGKTRVKPELLWDHETEKLSFSVASYDQDKEVPPAQIVTVLVPSGSDIDTTPDGLYAAAGVPKATYDVPAWPPGVPETPLTLPSRDESILYSGFVLAAWTS